MIDIKTKISDHAEILRRFPMIDRLCREFNTIFDSGGDIRVYFAPGRVNLIGEHTDYNGGHVFPCALTLGTYAVVQDRSDDKIRFYSMNFPDAGVIETGISGLHPSEQDGWADHPKGVVWAYEKRGLKMTHGLDILIWGNIPNGSGLSSSASLEVLTGLLLKDTFGFGSVSMTDVALIGQDAENNFTGCSCGIMDQFASAMGKKDHAIFLDTDTLDYEYAPVRLKDAQIVITNSNVKHSLVDSAYNDRRQECERALKLLQETCPIQTLGELTEEAFEDAKATLSDPVLYKRAKHAVYENQRTIRAKDALLNDDIPLFGSLMNASHISLRDDYEVSCAEVDCLVELAWNMPGVLGSRITGGGFGGCTVSIVKDSAVEAFQEDLRSAYHERFGLDAEFYLADIGDGARRLI